ncbi:unnamed protein product [Absidia cylindrospora]
MKIVRIRTNYEHPSFDAFVGINIVNFSKWSLNISARTDKELFRVWSIRYTKILRDLKPHIKPTSLKMNTGYWQAISRIKENLILSDAAYTANSMALMGKYSDKAMDILSGDINEPSGTERKRRHSVDENDAMQYSNDGGLKRRQVSQLQEEQGHCDRLDDKLTSEPSNKITHPRIFWTPPRQDQDD